MRSHSRDRGRQCGNAKRDELSRPLICCSASWSCSNGCCSASWLDSVSTHGLCSFSFSYAMLLGWILQSCSNGCSALLLGCSSLVLLCYHCLASTPW
uniref:Uncharacterized protein n=1 Tax=Arundo donax TaxID=35708 RepID=A0A0A8ZXY2_ARUDO